MPANGVNRETIRDAYVALVEAAMVGAGKPLQAVYGYQVGDFEDQSPVMVVTSGPSERVKKQLGTLFRDVHVTLYVHTFVAYAIEGTAWGEDDAEDRLDLIDKEHADLVADNANTADWDNLDLDGPTEPGVLTIGGTEYRYERTTVRARVLNG